MYILAESRDITLTIGKIESPVIVVVASPPPLPVSIFSDRENGDENCFFPAVERKYIFPSLSFVSSQAIGLSHWLCCFSLY